MPQYTRQHVYSIIKRTLRGPGSRATIENMCVSQVQLRRVYICRKKEGPKAKNVGHKVRSVRVPPPQSTHTHFPNSNCAGVHARTIYATARPSYVMRDGWDCGAVCDVLVAGKNEPRNDMKSGTSTASACPFAPQARPAHHVVCGYGPINGNNGPY